MSTATNKRRDAVAAYPIMPIAHAPDKLRHVSDAR